MIPFSMKILQFNKMLSSFIVEYIPDDSFYDTITHSITVDLLTDPPPTQDQVLSTLSKNSPQDYWEKQRGRQEMDTSYLEELKDRHVPSSMTKELATAGLSMPEIIPAEFVPPDLSAVDAFVQNILNEQSQ